MTRPLLIENARIVDPASGTDQMGAVLVEEGRISDLARGGPVGVPDDVEVINANGQVLAPGLIDMRVFVGEPGKEYRETLASAALQMARPRSSPPPCSAAPWPMRPISTCHSFITWPIPA
jgi:dihydroorotase-like cyclic amidohydrolase